MVEVCSFHLPVRLGLLLSVMSQIITRLAEYPIEILAIAVRPSGLKATSPAGSEVAKVDSRRGWVRSATSHKMTPNGPFGLSSSGGYPVKLPLSFITRVLPSELNAT